MCKIQINAHIVPKVWGRVRREVALFLQEQATIQSGADRVVVVLIRSLVSNACVKMLEASPLPWSQVFSQHSCKPQVPQVGQLPISVILQTMAATDELNVDDTAFLGVIKRQLWYPIYIWSPSCVIYITQGDRVVPFKLDTGAQVMAIPK